MEDTIILKRIFKGKAPDGGHVTATGKFYSLGNQAPYFSITTANGCDHESIVKAMPHLKPLCDIHLSDEHGAPMHALANAQHHADERDVKALIRHLRVTEDEAAMLAGDPTRVPAKVEALRPQWLEEAEAAKVLLTGDDWEADDLNEHSDDAMILYIDGDEVEITETWDHGHLPEAVSGSLRYTIAKDSDEAGKAAREYWTDMAANDPSEFACMVGEETLVQWGMGQSAGPGSEKVSSLDEWLDLYLTRPEEHFASHDGEERKAAINAALADALGMDCDDGQTLDVVVYRS